MSLGDLDQIGMISRERDPRKDEAGGCWRCDQLQLPVLPDRHHEQVRCSTLCQQLLQLGEEQK